MVATEDLVGVIKTRTKRKRDGDNEDQGTSEKRSKVVIDID